MRSAAGRSGKAGIGVGTSSGHQGRRLPSVLFVIGLLLLTAAFLLGAPQARAGGGDTHTWTGAGDRYRWSDPANWDKGVPSDGDSVIVKDSQDDIPGLTLKDVTMKGGSQPQYCGISAAYLVSLTLDGTLDSTTTYAWWDVPTSIGPAAVVSSEGTLWVNAPLTGGDAAGVLTKAGPGMTCVSQANTYAGATHVAAGVWQVKAGVVPAGSSVSIAEGATFEYYADNYPDPPVTATLDNVFSGPAGSTLKFTNTSVRLTGDSSAFAGTTTVENGEVSVLTGLGGSLGGAGWIGGRGTVGTLSPDAHLWVGFGGYGGSIDAGTLHTGSTEWADGGSYRWDITDAGGTPGSAGDLLAADGDLAVTAMGGYTIVPVTCATGYFGRCDGFDSSKAYRWPIVTATGAITGFHSRDFRVDTSMFRNPTGGGSFSVQMGTYAGSPSLDLVFTPAGSTAVWDGGAGWDDQGWSNRLNWRGDSVPSNGDDLVFANGVQTYGINDHFLTSIGSVDLGVGAYAGGSAVTMAGTITAHMDDDVGEGWDVPTTLTGDTTLRLTPITNPTGAAIGIGQDVSLLDGAGAGHTLTVDAGGESRAEIYGHIIGSDNDSSLVKEGTGSLRLAGNGDWSGSNTWAGPTYVQAGALRIGSPGALSCHTDVHIHSGATLMAEMWDEAAHVDVWSNTFTGSGSLQAAYGDLTLTGTSDSFTGTVECQRWASLTQTGSFPAQTFVSGLLRGTGTVGPLAADSTGILSPGVDDFESGTLSAGGTGGMSDGSSYVCDVGDVGGPAGSGYDQLAFAGDVTLAGTAGDPIRVVLRSGADGSEGAAAGFHKSGTYRWSVLRTSGSIAGFSTDTVSLDTSAFSTQNPTAGGTFSLEVVDHTTYQTLDVMYAPPAAVTLTWTGGSQTSSDWSDAANWDLGRAPKNGDCLIFTGDKRAATVNDIPGLTLADVTFSSMEVLSAEGEAVTLTGDLLEPDDLATSDWNLDTTLSSGGHMFSSFSQELRVGSDLSGGSAGQTTVTVAGGGLVRLSGNSTFAGNVGVNGSLDIRSAEALPAAAAVSVGGSGTLAFTNDTSGAWSVPNLVSGAGTAHLQVLNGSVKLTGDCSGFLGQSRTNGPGAQLTVAAGTTLNGTVLDNGALAGEGGLDDLDAEGIPWVISPTSSFILPCSVSPGDADYEVGTLSATGTTTIGGGANLVIDVSDQGDGLVYDKLSTVLLDVTADPNATPAGRVTIKLRSSDGSKAATLENFDPTQQYMWRVVSAGPTTVDDPACFVVDSSQFNGGSASGTFSVEPSSWDGLYVVYTPADTHTWTGGGSTDKWSNADNWDIGAPVNGDDLVFPLYTGATSENDLLTSVGSVDLNEPMVVSGSPLVLRGDFSMHRECAWGIDLTLAGDVTVSEDPGLTHAWLTATLSGDIAMDSTQYGPQALTVNVTGTNLKLDGVITGAADACSLTKTGSGSLRFAGEAGWTGPNTWQGPTDLRDGYVSFGSPGALPPLTNVTIATAATIDAYSPNGAFTDEWPNTFSGTGTFYDSDVDLTLSGASPDFNGSLSCGSSVSLIVTGSIGAQTDVYGGLRGTGTVAGMSAYGSPPDFVGTVSPGVADYQVGTLAADGGNADLGKDTRYVVDMNDATGTAGDAQGGWDLLAVTGTGKLTFNKPVTLQLRSSDGADAGDAAHFDNSKAGSWAIATAAGGVSAVAAGTVVVDASGFSNALAGGKFSVVRSLDGKELDLVFTPAPPGTHTWSGKGTSGNWSNPDNWVEHAAPTNGDSLVFPAGATNTGSTDDIAGLTTLGSVSIAPPGDGGYYDIEGSGTTPPLTITGTLSQTGSALYAPNQWWIDLTLSDTTHVKVSSGELLLLGKVAGDAGLTLDAGDGVLVLSFNGGLLTYTGDTTVEGNLRLQHADNLPYGAGAGDVHIGAGGSIDLNRYSQTANGLSGDGFVGNVSTYVGAGNTLTVGDADVSSEFSGQIGAAEDAAPVDEMAVTKIGAGTITLSGVCTYSGATTVSEGTLEAVAATAVPADSDLSIAADAAYSCDFDLRSTATLAGTISGPSGSTLHLGQYTTLILNGSGAAFEGTAVVDGSGVDVGVLHVAAGTTLGGALDGSGAVGGNGDIAGFGSIAYVFPGLHGWQPGPSRMYFPVIGVSTLHSAATTWASGQVVGAAMTDATGDAGVGYDQVQVAGDLTIDSGSTIVVAPVSSHDGSLGLCDGFDSATAGRWHVLRVSGSITGFDEATPVVNTDEFFNGFDGDFTLEQGSQMVGDTTYQTIDLVYTPAGPDTHTWTGAGEDSYWSTDANWDNGAPSSGDSLVFPADAESFSPENDITDLTLGAVTFTGGGDYVITGEPVGLTGSITRTDDGTAWDTWDIATELGGGNQFTCDSDAAGLRISGDLSGGVADDRTLTTDGPVAFGSPGDTTGASTYVGSTRVKSGSLHIFDPGLLSDTTDVAVEGGATLWITLDESAQRSWPGTLSGAGALDVTGGTLILYADSSSFTGATTIEPHTHLVVDGKLGGSVSGAGFLGGGGVTGPSGAGLWPGYSVGKGEFGIRELATGDLTLGAGSFTDFNIAAADGDPGIGYDTVTVDGDVTVSATKDSPCQVAPVTIAEGTFGDCTGFDNTQSYVWHIVRATGSISGFDAAAFSPVDFVFNNDLGGGALSVVQGTEKVGGTTYQTVDLVFTPSTPDITISSGPTIGAGGTQFAKGSNQTIAWETSQTPPAGSVFNVVADDPSSSTDVLLASVDAADATKYSDDWTIAQGPSAGWKVQVQLWTAGASGTQLCSADSVSFDILAAAYKITVTAGDHGSITPVTGDVTTFSDQKYTIKPDDGYHIASLTVDDAAETVAASWTFHSVTATHSIAATFAIDTFTITPSVVGGVGGHGTISPADDQTVDYGATPKFTFKADEGYGVAVVRVDGDIVSVSDASYTFAAVTGNHTISVSYTVLTYGIFSSVVGGADGHGTISPSGKGSKLDYGATPTFTFKPDLHYHVKQVKVDDVAVTMTATDEYTFPAVKADHTISVEFAIDTVAITVTAGAHGSITPGTGEVDYGSSPTYTITPAEGYHIASLTVDDVTQTVAGSWTFTDVTAAQSIAATFAIDTYTITSGVVGGEAGHGSISPVGPQTVAWHATPAFTFAPEAGYTIGTVTVDGTPVQLTGPGSYTFPAVAADHALSVSFVVKPADDPPLIAVQTGLAPSAAQARWRRAKAAPVTVTATDPDGGTVAAFNWRFVSTAGATSAATSSTGATATGATPAGQTYSVPMHAGQAGAFTADCTMTRQGTAQVEYWVTNGAGIESRHYVGYYKLDTSKPRVQVKRCSVLAGHKARLRYRVVDAVPGDDRDLVRAVVVNSHNGALARAKAKNVLANTWRKMIVDTRRLAPGRYLVALRARDAAGNFQPTVTRTWIRVR